MTSQCSMSSGGIVSSNRVMAAIYPVVRVVRSETGLGDRVAGGLVDRAASVVPGGVQDPVEVGAQVEASVSGRH